LFVCLFAFRWPLVSPVSAEASQEGLGLPDTYLLQLFVVCQGHTKIHLAMAIPSDQFLNVPIIVFPAPHCNNGSTGINFLGESDLDQVRHG
jgi:hypothetical protein